MMPTNRSRAALWLAALAIATIAFGCNDESNPTAPEPTPEPPRVAERFRGSFGQKETSEHSFTVSQTGTVELKIIKLEPVATLTVGLGIGRFDATAMPPCTVFASDRRVVVGSVLISGSVAPGEYCVQIGDVGNVFPDATVTYTVEVLHP